MSRLSKEQLDKIMEQEGVSRLWSWSRVHTFMISPYEYYLKYVIHAKEDRNDCIYTTTGGMCHGIIEKLYTGEIKYEDMPNLFEDGWLTAYDISQLKFDRNDEEKNQKIANKYYEDLKHFFKNHKMLKYKPMIEQFIKIKVGDNVLHGYIDCCFKDDDGNYNIIDWKSSSIYKGAKAEEECGQLVLYAVGLNQAGIPMSKIRIAWDFLKYCCVDVTQKNGVVKTREIERSKLGESLTTNCRMWLKEFGYADEADDYLKLLLDTNNLDVLPDEVRAKYDMRDCFVYVDLTDKLIDKWVNLIDTTIKDIELREKDYAENGSENAFWDTDENVEAQSYYFATLSGFSPSQHKPYAAYLDKLEAKKNGMDFFGGVGDNVESKEIVSTIDTTNAKNAQDDSINLDWLDSIEI